MVKKKERTSEKRKKKKTKNKKGVWKIFHHQKIYKNALSFSLKNTN